MEMILGFSTICQMIEMILGFCTIGQLMKSMFTMKYSKKKIIQSLL